MEIQSSVNSVDAFYAFSCCRPVFWPCPVNRRDPSSCLCRVIYTQDMKGSTKMKNPCFLEHVVRGSNACLILILSAISIGNVLLASEHVVVRIGIPEAALHLLAFPFSIAVAVYCAHLVGKRFSRRVHLLLSLALSGLAAYQLGFMPFVKLFGAILILVSLQISLAVNSFCK